MKTKTTPAIFKPRAVVATTNKADIEGRLRKTFVDMLEQAGVIEVNVGSGVFDRIITAMRSANKLGYTNGYIKSSIK